MSPFRRRRSESDRHTWLRIDGSRGGRYLGIPPTVTNSMAGQDEHAYSLDHPQPPHSAKFNSRRDNPLSLSISYS